MMLEVHFESDGNAGRHTEERLCLVDEQSLGENLGLYEGLFLSDVNDAEILIAGVLGKQTE
jgi:hypothetical protein